jgi:DNA ligase-1
LFGHLHGADGELIVGDVTAHDVFQKTTSGVMSKEGEPDVTLYVFDMWNQTDKTYESRYNTLLEVIYQQPHVYDVRYNTINTHKELLAYADKQIQAGYEGIMLRNPNTTYKHGRATNNTQELLKYKLFEDGEFKCIGIEELMHNENELKLDELGYAERSSCKEGLKPSGMLGALILMWKDHEKLTVSTFKVGTGFTEQQRKDIFAEKDSDNSIIGKFVKVKYQSSGMKDKPRFPSFVGVRSIEDM